MVAVYFSFDFLYYMLLGALSREGFLTRSVILYIHILLASSLPSEAAWTIFSYVEVFTSVLKGLINFNFYCTNNTVYSSTEDKNESYL